MSIEHQVGQTADSEKPETGSADDLLIPLGNKKPINDNTGSVDMALPSGLFSRGDDTRTRTREPDPGLEDEFDQVANVGSPSGTRRNSSHTVERDAHGDGGTGAEREGAVSKKRNRRSARTARRVERVVSRVDVWSLVKVSAIFYLCLWMVVTIAGVILWRVASSLGLISNIEKFVAELIAEETVKINGGNLFKASLIGGVVMSVAATGFTGLMAMVFNLISSVTGGIRFKVIEVETARPAGRQVGGKARFRS